MEKATVPLEEFLLRTPKETLSRGKLILNHWDKRFYVRFNIKSNSFSLFEHDRECSSNGWEPGKVTISTFLQHFGKNVTYEYSFIPLSKEQVTIYL